MDYTLTDLKSYFSHTNIDDGTIDTVFTAIDEDHNNVIDSIDASFSFNEYATNEEASAVLGLSNTFQPSSNIFLPECDITNLFPVCDLMEKNSFDTCSNEPLTPEESQTAIDLFNSICVFLSDDSLNKWGEVYQFCQPGASVYTSNDTTDLKSQMTQDPLDSWEFADDQPSVRKKLTPPPTSIIFEDNKEGYTKIIDGIYDSIVADESLSQEERDKTLGNLEALMSDPSGRVINVVFPSELESTE